MLHLLLWLGALCQAKIQNGVCDMYLGKTYEMTGWPENPHLVVSVGLSYARIGQGHQINQATVFMNSAAELVMPSYWYRDTFPTGGAEAYGGCSSRILTNVEIGAVAKPEMSLGSVHELAGRTWLWSSETSTIFSDRWAADQFDIARDPYNGIAMSSGCKLFDCVFNAQISNADNLRLVFAGDRAGIGLSSRLVPQNGCTTLIIHPNLHVPVCSDTKACRMNNMICANQVYILDEDETADIVVGADLMNGNIMFLFEDDKTTVAYEWSVTDMWSDDLPRTVITCTFIFFVMAWIPRPMAADVKDALTQVRISRLNIGVVGFILISIVYMVSVTNPMHDMRRSTSLGMIPSFAIAAMLYTSIVFLCIKLVYLRVLTSSRNEIRIVYSSLLCECILAVSIGSPNFDLWSALSCGISVTFFYVVPSTIVSTGVSLTTFVAIVAAAPAALLAGVSPSMSMIGTESPVLSAVCLIALMAEYSVWTELAPRLRAAKLMS